jgi:uncharacterized protein YdbL (DUF1318 family)
MRRALFCNTLAFLLAACVTVNVYFPAAAAEQVADKYIDQFTGQSGQAQPQTAPAPAPQEPPTSRVVPGSDRPILLAAVGNVLELLVPAAQAQGSANLDAESAETRAVSASITRRFKQLEKYFNSGVVGLTANGMIEIRDQNAVPLAERATVKRLVAEDNSDRKTFYTELAKANGHPEWADDIRKTFARRWVERAKSGWYYQSGGGGWTQKQ